MATQRAVSVMLSRTGREAGIDPSGARAARGAPRWNQEDPPSIAAQDVPQDAAGGAAASAAAAPRNPGDEPRQEGLGGAGLHVEVAGALELAHQPLARQQRRLPAPHP